jgi:hypothetical protein
LRDRAALGALLWPTGDADAQGYEAVVVTDAPERRFDLTKLARRRLTDRQVVALAAAKSAETAENLCRELRPVAA